MKKSKGIIGGLQAFMDSAKGKTILNYFYSWGAAIVILGTLFKLTHLPGANIMLFLGMGTEVIVFFFSAFERPYDIAEEESAEERMRENMGTAMGQPIIINGSIMTGGGTFTIPQGEVAQHVASEQHAESNDMAQAESEEEFVPAAVEGNAATTPFVGGYTGPVPVGGYAVQTPQIPAASISEMDKATEEYVEKVRLLTEAIQNISQQTEALGRNMAEMDTLSRNLTGVNALYEVHLRSAGGQLNAIDQVNEQTKKMAQQIEELNSLYARMIDAMTSNINRPQI